MKVLDWVYVLLGGFLTLLESVGKWRFLTPYIFGFIAWHFTKTPYVVFIVMAVFFWATAYVTPKEEQGSFSRSYASASRYFLLFALISIGVRLFIYIAAHKREITTVQGEIVAIEYVRVGTTSSYYRIFLEDDPKGYADLPDPLNGKPYSCVAGGAEVADVYEFQVFYSIGIPHIRSCKLLEEGSP